MIFTEINITHYHIDNIAYYRKKCHILTITRQRLKPPVDYHLGAEPLTVVDSYPYVGVTISSDLRWNKYIANISAKAARMFNLVRRNIYCCPPEAKSLAYNSLV